MATLPEIEAEIARRQGLAEQPIPSVLPPEQQAFTPETDRRMQLAQAPSAQEQRQAAEVPQPAEQDSGIMEFLDKGIPAPVAELAAAVNRGTLSLADFLTDPIMQGAAKVAGVEGGFTGQFKGAAGEGIEGGFMEEGLPRRIVQTAGEFVGPVGATGQAIRTVAQAAPKIGATLTQKVAQAAATTPAVELGGAITAGAGSEVGAEVGGEIGATIAGEEGRAAGERRGRLAGMFIAPLGVAVAKQTGKQLLTAGAKKLLNEAAPTVQGLKQAARVVYNELDNIGVTVNPASVTKLSQSLQSLAKKSGFDKDIQKKVAAGLRKISGVEGKEQTLSEIDILRRVMNNAAKSTEPADKELGTIMVQRIDDFLDNLNKANFSKAFNKDVGAKYKDSRQLWRRAKKTEQLEKAVLNASDAKAPFFTAIEGEFRSIIKSDKKSLGFTKEEIQAMRNVVRGGPIKKVVENLSKLGLSSNNIVAQILGIGAGGATMGAGAVAVPIAGEIAATISTQLAKNSARNIQLLTRAGSSGRSVVKEYMKLVPPKQRSAEELTGLLLRPDVSLEGLKAAARGATPKNANLVNDAVFLTNAVKAMQQEQE